MTFMRHSLIDSLSRSWIAYLLCQCLMVPLKRIKLEQSLPATAGNLEVKTRRRLHVDTFTFGHIDIPTLVCL